MSHHKKGERTPMPAQPEEKAVRETDEEDVEGHFMLPNLVERQELARAREREIQRSLQERGRAAELKRPFRRS